MPGTVPNTLQDLSHLILATTPCYNLRFTIIKTQTQKVELFAQGPS